jgi:hypothetical protein
MRLFQIGAGLFAGATLLIGSAANAPAQLAPQQGLVEPNFTTDSALLAVPGVNAQLVETLKNARPILSIIALDSILAASSVTKAQRPLMYDRVFVHVDLNRGTDAELLLIPGVDNAMLQVIKAGRPYKTFAQFETALGKAAKPADVQRIERYVFIPMELNTFTQEIIESFAPIGVGTRRWIREFNEYRPYTSMAQWEREISKYLRNNPNELKRLQRYVYIEGQ